MSQKLQFEISKEEAIVLFEYLSRVHDSDALEGTFEHQAEQIVLWNLQAAFEKHLAEVFASEYSTIVAGARNALICDTDIVQKHKEE